MARYVIVPDRSRVIIDASSSVHPIHSETSGIEGRLDVKVGRAGAVSKDHPGPDGWARLELAVDRLRSGNPLEDREMSRRMDTRHHPTITGEARSITKTDTAGHYRVKGDITMKGVTQPHEDDVTISVEDDGGLRIQGSSTFDVRDFGMQPPKILMLRVHPDVKVTIDLVAVPAD